MSIKNTAIRMNIYKLLCEKNLNQSDLPFSKSVSSKLLNGKTEINDNHLNILSQFFGVSVDYLKNQEEFLADLNSLSNHEHLYDAYNYKGKELITANGKDFISTLGDSNLLNIIEGVLLGDNVRDLTETITRARLLISNASILDLFLKTNLNELNTENYFNLLSKMLTLSSNDDERILSLWMLGLTKKGLDNIVRGQQNLIQYTDRLKRTFTNSTTTINSHFGELSGEIVLNGKKISINWEFFNRLFTIIGAQTLTVRGSSKSMNGKLFEKLILGSLFTLLGFTFHDNIPTEFLPSDKIFCLSSTDENDRETDATLIFNGKAISVDIGFIGKGNPEITLDKVTRFRNFKELGKVTHSLSTIIIVDSVGENSNLFAMAKEINGHVFQMKNSDWVLNVSKCIASILDLDLDIIHDESTFEAYIKDNIKKIDLMKFL
ncbi:CfrBI family restriction endonuclease [Clostridium perfringens]|uniref:CfrBI family restriction endonuclease n=1 Tax=Clostridium perfringens TaxID=1502 RepID=UPI003A29BD8D